MNRGDIDTIRLGPNREIVFGPDQQLNSTAEEIVRQAQRILDLRNSGTNMHYRNGREAFNGDKCVKLEGGGQYGPVKIVAVGVLFDAKPGNDYCNGSIASTIGGPVVGACLCDMLHADDLSAILTEKGLDKRPAGK